MWLNEKEVLSKVQRLTFITNKSKETRSACRRKSWIEGTFGLLTDARAYWEPDEEKYGASERIPVLMVRKCNAGPC